MAFTDQYKFISHDGKTIVNSGVKQLWGLCEQTQADILGIAMERFDANRSLSLGALGFSRLTAGDLVRKQDEFHGSRLSDKDIITSLLLGNLDIYPLSAFIAQNLGRDALDCGIWDGEFGEAGYFYKQDARAWIGMINPADGGGLQAMWDGPHQIPRIREIKRQEPYFNDTNMDPNDGCLIIEPGIAYLFGYWPAISIEGLNVRLETRSNYGRWTLAGAVNSVTVHSPYNGILTAEATTFASLKTEWSTSWLPFQMIFEYLNPGLNRESHITFGESQNISVEEAARESQRNPNTMLPRMAKSQRVISK